jgi:hypothetical protein
MAQNRYYSSGYFPTQLAAAITSPSATTISVQSITGAPTNYPFTMLIDWGLPIQEAVSVTAAPTGSGPYTLTVTRGIDGTTAQTHLNGAVATHGVSAEDYNEPQVHVSLGTSGTGINQVHGLANGSSVVGTTDTQTLTNKTLGATTFTAPITLSSATSAGDQVTVTNTTSAPTNPNIQFKAASTSDSELGVGASGDTYSRLQVFGSGQVGWGAGSSNVDTYLQRNAAGELGMTSGGNFSVPNNLAVGGAQLAAGGAGVMGLNNATTLPSSTPSGGAVMYAKSGFKKFRGGDGADYNSGQQISVVGSSGVSVTTSSTPVTGLSAVIGTAVTYLIIVNLEFLPAGSSGTTTFNFAFTGTAGTVTLNYKIMQQGAANVVTMSAGNNTAITSNIVSPTNATNAATLEVFGTMTASVAGTLTLTGIGSTGNATVEGGSFLKVHALA